MTMVVAYAWQDKIIIMADSRSSARDDNGKMLEYNDQGYKIITVQNKFAIGHAGLREISIGGGNHFELNNITEHFLDVNRHFLSKATGEQFLKGLVEMWNRTLSEKMQRDPFSLDNRFCFLMANFVENENGELNPKIHSYQSHFQEFQWGGNKAVIGDDAVYPIITPYFQTNTDDWTFDKVLDFYLKGFLEVMDQVETVGGPIDIYVLDANPDNSYWLERKPRN
jgi:hypothetical protein